MGSLLMQLFDSLALGCACAMVFMSLALVATVFWSDHGA
jgi:hypothetical protein